MCYCSLNVHVESFYCDNVAQFVPRKKKDFPWHDGKNNFFSCKKS